MRARTLISAITVLILMLAGLAVAQENPNVTIKKVRAPETSPASGQQMYVSYCASCHGKNGVGDGPAAPALKVPPTNLTMLAKQNGGKFPSDHVATILAGGAVVAHGSADMPVWGTIFRSMNGGHAPEIQLRITNLTKYLESMQAK